MANRGLGVGENDGDRGPDSSDDGEIALGQKRCVLSSCISM